MPLALQALLPFLFLCGGAAAVSLTPRKRYRGPIAIVATALPLAVAVTLLARLAPAERVDIPYLRLFPDADVAIRLDALSAVFAVVLLLTACLLMLARSSAADDRRQPWSSWLLTTAAALSVIFAANLLLLYIVLQLLTLAWSGALDETAPRFRVTRMAEQVADLGLLLVAGLMTASVGTSAMSGIPSDAIGSPAFLLALAPVAVRIGALAQLTERPRSPVIFEPAIARAAVAGYLLLRLISLTGGRPPGRAVQVLLFAAGLAAAALFLARAARQRSAAGAQLKLAAAQAGIASAMCAPGTPLAALAGVWAWLGVILLTGLATVRHDDRSLAGPLKAAALATLPPGFLFTGVWLGSLALAEQHLAIAILPLGLLAAAMAAVALHSMSPPEPARISLAAGFGAALILAGLIPGPLLALAVTPAARIVRAIPGGTVRPELLGIRTDTAFLPLLPVGLLVGAAIAVWLYAGAPRPRARFPAIAPARLPSLNTSAPSLRQAAGRIAGLPWMRLGWLAYGVAIAAAIALR
ncbi:MAG TPA: hypothetical protein VET65_10540 [Candidatus Limnocylindrales bacterium]|nr:hypothetical protein [Candidatus Limnocylindrales bacterium]